MSTTDTFNKLDAAIKKAKSLEAEKDKAQGVLNEATKAHSFAVGEVNKLREELNAALGNMFGDSRVRQA